MHLQMTGVDSTGGGGARLVADTGGGCRRSLQCVSVLCESRQCAAHRLSESGLGQLCVSVCGIYQPQCLQATEWWPSYALESGLS